MAISAKVIKKVSISDGVGVSSGQPPGTPAGAQTGISTRQRGGGGGGQVIAETPQQQEQQKQISQQAGYRQRAVAAQQQKQLDEERARRESQGKYQTERAEAQERAYGFKPEETYGGVYEKGGAAIHETRTKTKDPTKSKAELDRLQKQQPGSAVVYDTASGEYVLIRSRGLNLQAQSTLATINRNIEAEGGTGYSPTKIPKAGGGFLNLVDVRENIGISEPTPPEGGEPTGTPVLPIRPEGAKRAEYKI